ncbi:hypothetical protein AOQ84DRAFT_409262, partial [Glonium stellatum]
QRPPRSCYRACQAKPRSLSLRVASTGDLYAALGNGPERPRHPLRGPIVGYRDGRACADRAPSTNCAIVPLYPSGRIQLRDAPPLRRHVRSSSSSSIRCSIRGSSRSNTQQSRQQSQSVAAITAITTITSLAALAVRQTKHGRPSHSWWCRAHPEAARQSRKETLNVRPSDMGRSSLSLLFVTQRPGSPLCESLRLLVCCRFLSGGGGS